jgi:hypothetical protein
LKEEGYTVVIHYSPEDIAKMDGAKECEITPEEADAFSVYSFKDQKVMSGV